eukprot:1161280-Pelagomonas_calceolata.AAC.13
MSNCNGLSRNVCILVCREERAERGGGGDVPGSKGSSQLGAGGLELGSGPASKAVQNQVCCAGAPGTRRVIGTGI